MAYTALILGTILTASQIATIKSSSVFVLGMPGALGGGLSENRGGSSGKFLAIMVKEFVNRRKVLVDCSPDLQWNTSLRGSLSKSLSCFVSKIEVSYN